MRDELGRRFLEFKTNHAGASDLDTSDKDPMRYLSEVTAEISADGESGTLGIGSLKGR